MLMGPEGEGDAWRSSVSQNYWLLKIVASDGFIQLDPSTPL